eukprot:TRINITY_DN11451_c0_g1_i3.p1 TRINITY_DN11451_c0_g1~~TRINITY_DN11451_c0_g1_i3.p1  ORF type:complete len:633 (+),score=123.73 TRINITY_DN11451_c0_g1_i3:108-2006(+)
MSAVSSPSRLTRTPSVEQKTPRLDNTALESELKQTKELLDSRTQYSRSLQRNYEALSIFCKKNKTEISNLKSLLDAAEQKISQLEVERNNLVRASQNEQAFAAENARLKERIQVTQDALESMQQKCTQLEDRIEELLDTNRDVLDELARLRNADRSRQDQLARLEERLKDPSSRAQLREWEQKYQLLVAERSEILKASEQKDDELRAMRVERQKLDNRLKRTELDRDEFKNQYTRIKKSQAQLQNQFKEAEAAIVTLRQSVAGLELEVASLSSQLNLDRLNQNETQKLSDVVQQRDALQQERDQYAQALALLQQQYNDQLPALLKQLEEEQSRSQSQLSDLAALKAILAGKEAEMMSLRSGQVELEHLRQINTQLNTQLVEAKRALTPEATFPEKKKMQNEIQQLQTLLAQLEARLSKQKAEMKEDYERDIKHLNTQLLELSQENQELPRLKKLLADAQQALSEAESEKQKIREDVGAMNQKKYQELMDSMRGEIASLNAKLMEAQHKNAELNAMLDRPYVNAAEVERLKEREQEVKVVIAKLVKAEESTEGAFTCLSCLGIYKRPVTCIPCGHSFCSECIETNGYCTQCGPSVQVSYYPNDLLDQLTAKYVFRKQALASLKSMDKRPSSRN